MRYEINSNLTSNVSSQCWRAWIPQLDYDYLQLVLSAYCQWCGDEQYHFLLVRFYCSNESSYYFLYIVACGE